MPLSISSLTSYFRGKEEPFSPLTKEGAIIPANKSKENEPFFRSHKEIVVITCLVGMSSLAINYAPRLVGFASLAALALSQGGIYSTIGLGGLGALTLGYFGLHNSSLGSFLTAAVENVKSHSANKAQSNPAVGEGKAKAVEEQIIESAQGMLGKPVQDLLDKTLPKVSTLVTNKVQDLVTGLITPNKALPLPAKAAPGTPKPIAKQVDPASTAQPKSALHQASATTQSQKKRVRIKEPKEKQPKKELVNSLIEESKKVKLTSEEMEKFESIYQTTAPRIKAPAPKQTIEKASKKEPKKDELTTKELKKFETAYQQSNPAITRAPQTPRATNPEMPIYSKPTYGPPQTEEIRKVTNRLAHLHNHLLGIQPPLSVPPPTLFPPKIQTRL